MDGFYVAKIQKLSDKRPGDEDDDKVKEEVVVENENEESEAEEINWAAEVKKALPNKQGRHEVRTEKMDGDSKKRAPAHDESSSAKEPKVKSHVSVPPKKQNKQKKTSTNAKVAKPRRRKQPVEM